MSVYSLAQAAQCLLAALELYHSLHSLSQRPLLPVPEMVFSGGVNPGFRDGRQSSVLLGRLERHPCPPQSAKDFPRHSSAPERLGVQMRAIATEVGGGGWGLGCSWVRLRRGAGVCSLEGGQQASSDKFVGPEIQHLEIGT